jgi:hypothetical protein
MTTSVPSGVEATWPVETTDAVDETVAFGTQAKTMKAVSGKPTPYVAPPIEEGDDEGHRLTSTTGGVSNKVIIGVCVGLVLPILAAIIGAIM